MGVSSGRPDEAAGRADRRGHRPAGQRSRSHGDSGQGHRSAAGREYARCGQCALQRLWPAPGRHHLQRHQPVPRHHGDCPAFYPQPGIAQGHLRAGERDGQRSQHGRHDGCSHRQRGSSGQQRRPLHIDQYRQSGPARPLHRPGADIAADQHGAAVGAGALFRKSQSLVSQSPGWRTCNHGFVQHGRR